MWTLPALPASLAMRVASTDWAGARVAPSRLWL
jgi:hypothetical protein